MSLAGLALIAAGAIVLLLAIIEGIARAAGTEFFATVILGEDGRTSTSKAFILMWTLLVGWSLVVLLIAGEFVSPHACVPRSDIANAARACQAAGDEVGLMQVGWLNFLHHGLAGSYLILLGVPATAGIAAKGITQAQVNSPTGFKTTKARQKGLHPFARLAEIFCADDGSTDIADFQYLIFNLITGVYFVAQFLNPDGSGLPTIPDTLLGLTSVSAGLYVGKKAVTRSQPAVTGVFPLPLHDGAQFTVLGTGLTPDPAAQGDAEPQITIDGLPATLVRMTDDGRLIARAPADLGVRGSVTVRQLQVLNPYGGISPTYQVQCS